MKLSKREIKKQMLGYTPKQRQAFEYFAKRHPYWKFRSIHFDRRVGFWICLVGAVTYFCRPEDLRRKSRGR